MTLGQVAHDVRVGSPDLKVFSSALLGPKVIHPGSRRVGLPE